MSTLGGQGMPHDHEDDDSLRRDVRQLLEILLGKNKREDGLVHQFDRVKIEHELMWKLLIGMIGVVLMFALGAILSLVWVQRKAAIGPNHAQISVAAVHARE